MSSPSLLLGEPMVVEQTRCSWKVIGSLFLLTGLCCTVVMVNSQPGAQPSAVELAGMPVTRPAVRGTPAVLGCPVKVLPAIVGGVAATVFTASMANAATVKLGSDTGGLVFVPDALTIKAGETVEFVNNAGFPHNIVFDEDDVPDGVNAEALGQEEYLNAPGETHSVKFDKAGQYGYYCQPHKGAGMKGKITVQ